MQYSIAMAFEQALRDGDLDHARAILDELAELPDTGGLWLPECYGDLAQSYDRRGGHDSVAACPQRAMLVRLATQVQEVLRTRGCTADARHWRVAYGAAGQRVRRSPIRAASSALSSLFSRRRRLFSSIRRMLRWRSDASEAR